MIRHMCTSHQTDTLGIVHRSNNATCPAILVQKSEIKVRLFNLLQRTAANHHKPPPKRRKYAGFGTKGIRESIVLHRHGLATLKEP